MEIAIFVLSGIIILAVGLYSFLSPKIDIDTPEPKLKAEVFLSEKPSPKKTPRPRKKK
jgi:hypothetical protein